MTIVIPFAGDAENLRFTLRSICQHIPHDQLFIIGNLPEWYQGDHIPHRSATNQAFKALDILNKTLLSPVEEFVRMSDDYIFTASFDCSKYYTMGNLAELRDSKTKGNTFRTIVENTISIAGNIRSLEQHCPIPMAVKCLRLVLTSHDWTYPNGYLIRSLYGRHINAVTHYRADVVLHRGLPGDQPLFSIGCYNYTKEMYAWLNSKFPIPCKYEK